MKYSLLTAPENCPDSRVGSSHAEIHDLRPAFTQVNLLTPNIPVQTTLPSIDFTRIRPHVNSEQHAMISDIQMEPVWVPVPSKSYGLLKNLLPPDSNLGPPSCETLSPYHRDWRPQHLSIPVRITNIECQNSIKTI
ncbi:hypothetical protein M8J76_009695 [Diaphorina citri]|nr:hypothetical protein M8J76_009695 [Diaphorina citri]